MENRIWLKVESNPKGEEIMFCDFCIKAHISRDKTSSINGCTNFKLETIKHHESSNMHLYSVNKHPNEAKPTEAPAL